jgi:hypothetical protein
MKVGEIQLGLRLRANDQAAEIHHPGECSLDIPTPQLTVMLSRRLHSV